MRRFIALSAALLAAAALLACGKSGGGVSRLSEHVCSADDGLELAKNENVAVIEGSSFTSGVELWEAFYKEASEGTPCAVTVAHWYGADVSSDGKDALFFADIKYNGDVYEVKVRKSEEEEPEYEETFKYLRHEKGENDKYAAHRYFDSYYLADDPEATFKGIIEGYYSSSVGVGYKSYMVYHEYYD